MSTEKQIAANHRNAQSSTGPRTPEGKARSSLNAVTHGLTPAQILIPSESADDFESHAASFRDRFAPVDSVESFLVDQMIVAAWRLRRTRLLESSVYAQRAFEVARNQREREEELTDAADHIVTGYRRECSGTNSLENISRQETRIERAFYRPMHELDRLRNLKGRILQNEPNLPSSADRGAGLQPAAVALAAEPSLHRGADEASAPQRSAGGRLVRDVTGGCSGGRLSVIENPPSGRQAVEEYRELGSPHRRDLESANEFLATLAKRLDGIRAGRI